MSSHDILAQRSVMAAGRPEHNGGYDGRDRISCLRRPLGPILAVPVFIAALAVAVLLFGGIESKANSRRALLVLHAALLGGCLELALGFGPFRSADSQVAVLAGTLAVAAMATQNALVKWPW